ncbi:MAG: hypothetical protein H6812_12510 [Phycisphaeraceae bacterium]|nr:hypothetical protein [Phycisphaerales bacterium]MCB9844060.1 hypothetical protein [Phycisphaeraceae bacterium]
MSDRTEIMSLDLRARRTASGFTLIELLVAVGAVLLLSVGVGQIFRQVGNLVNTGSSAAEIDQLARALERQMADDFRALSLMPQDETFMVIRGRWIGDVNNNQMLDNNERAIYLTPEDREADLRDGIDPYEAGSRAVTIRADEIAFLVDGREYRTAQVDPLGATDFATNGARIYYGQALRPHSEIDPTSDFDDPTRYEREYDPDGDFGQRAGETNAFFNDEVSADARNEYASEILLARQALLLGGSVAAGYQGNPPRPPLIGSQRAYTPYIRDLEANDRFFGINYNFETNPPELRSSDVGGANINPSIRLARHGRVDICAMTVDEIRRWLEGEDPMSTSGNVSSRDASPFKAPGAWDGNNSFDAPLWQRDLITDPNQGPRRTIAANAARLRVALGGCISRMLADNQLPVIIRDREDSDEDPEDALMDLHAVLASKCSSVEFAWNDGTVWTDRNNLLMLRRGNGGLAEPVANIEDAEVVYRFGDVIWFDAFMPRSYYLFNLASPTQAIPFPNEEEVDGVGRPRTSNFANNLSEPATYDQTTTGGVPGEYLSTWGFRKPSSNGGYGGAWVKPQMIRARITLHDATVRIQGGKTFEYIFNTGNQS